jgi:ferritin
MLNTQVADMLTMDDASLKTYLQKECKHKDEILQRIASMRNEALANKEQDHFNELCWLYNVVKGTEVLCP